MQTLEEVTVENIEGLAELAQKSCYGDLSRIHSVQKAETKQFYIMGFFEGLQFGAKVPADKYEALFNEVKDAIQKRVNELYEKKV